MTQYIIAVKKEKDNVKLEDVDIRSGIVYSVEKEQFDSAPESSVAQQLRGALSALIDL